MKRKKRILFSFSKIILLFFQFIWESWAFLKLSKRRFFSVTIIRTHITNLIGLLSRRMGRGYAIYFCFRRKQKKMGWLENPLYKSSTLNRTMPIRELPWKLYTICCNGFWDLQWHEYILCMIIKNFFKNSFDYISSGRSMLSTSNFDDTSVKYRTINKSGHD